MTDSAPFVTRFLCDACDDWFCIRCSEHLGDCPCLVCMACGETSEPEADVCAGCGTADGFMFNGDLSDWENESADENLGADDPP